MDATRRTGLLAACALSLLASAPAAAAAEDKPADLGLTESAQRRLVQVELVVDGPPERVAALLPADLDVMIGGKSIEDFYLDVGCAGSPAGAAPPDGMTPASVAVYFDQSHLTVAGRTRAYASAEVLAASLAAAGHRVRIISNGPRLMRRTSWTADPAILDGALQALRKDMSTVQGTDTWERFELEKLLADAEDLDQREQWLPKCKGCPEQMFATVTRDVASGGGNSSGSPGGGGAVAVGRQPTGGRRIMSFAPQEPELPAFKEAVTVCLAHEFARLLRDAELWAADVVRGDQASFERLANFLIEMETVPGPKAVVLYAEKLRRRGSQALLDAWRDSPALRSLQARCPGRERIATLGGMGGVVDRDATLYMDRVLQQASARRVRLHAVGEGLYDDTSAEAKRTLAGLALETGGRSFFGAATDAQSISQAVLRDATCPVVLSFDPDSLPTGRLTAFAVKSRAEGVRIRAPGLVFSESPEQFRHARWLAAALNAGSEPGDPPVFVGVIPLGREDGKFQTLVQVVAPPRAGRTPRWDLGALAFDRDVAVKEESGSVTARPPGVLVVLEATMPIVATRPALVGIGLDTETDEVGAMRREDAWPDLRASRAGLSPLALVQPAQGGFVREGKTRTSGTLTVQPDRGPDPQRPLGVLGLACRGRREQGQLVVERMLSGEKDYTFEPIVLDVPPDGCAQFRDTVPAGTLGDGGYRYQARIVAEGEELARQTVAFSVGAK